jgi:hypothetical protein
LSWRAVVIGTSELAETKIVTALTVCYSTLDTSLSVSCVSHRGGVISLCRRSRVGPERRLSLAGCDVQTNSQRRETTAVERVRKAGGNGTNIGIKVVQAAGTDSCNVHKRGIRQDVGTATLESECLLAKASIDLNKSSSSRDLFRDSVAS